MDFVSEIKKQRASRKLVEEIAETCFDSCVYNFTSRVVDPREKLCIYHCTEKYLLHSIKVTKILTEQAILNK